MDTATRQDFITRYGAAYTNVQAALAELPRAMWQFKPAPDEWSIHEQLVHLADSEAYSYTRLRHLVAEPGSTIMAYDEAGWAVRTDYHAQDPDAALETFRWLRQMSYALLQTLPEAAFANTVEHSASGTWSMDDWLRIYTTHVENHIAQMESVFAAWQVAEG